VHDSDWPGFANAILKHSDETESTPSAFYNYYYWGNVVKRLLEKI